MNQSNSLQEVLDQSNLAKRHLSGLTIQLQSKESQLAKNKTRLSGLFAANKVASFAEFTDLKKKAEEQEQLKMKIAALQNGLQVGLAQLEKITQNPDALTKNKVQLGEQITHRRNQINNLHAENAKLKN